MRWKMILSVTSGVLLGVGISAVVHLVQAPELPERVAYAIRSGTDTPAGSADIWILIPDEGAAPEVLPDDAITDLSFIEQHQLVVSVKRGEIFRRDQFSP